MELLRIAMNHSMLIFLCCVLLANECRGPPVGDDGEESFGHKCLKGCVRCLTISSVLGGFSNVGGVEGIRPVGTMNGLVPGGAPGPSQPIGQMAPAPSPYAELGNYASSELYNKNCELLMLQRDEAEAELGREKEKTDAERLEKLNKLAINSFKPHAIRRTNNRQKNKNKAEAEKEPKMKTKEAEKQPKMEAVKKAAEEEKPNELLIHGPAGRNWFLSTNPHATPRKNNRQINVGNGKQAVERKANNKQQLEEMRMMIDETKALEMAEKNLKEMTLRNQQKNKN